MPTPPLIPINIGESSSWGPCPKSCQVGPWFQCDMWLCHMWLCHMCHVAMWLCDMWQWPCDMWLCDFVTCDMWQKIPLNQASHGIPNMIKLFKLFPTGLGLHLIDMWTMWQKNSLNQASHKIPNMVKLVKYTYINFLNAMELSHMCDNVWQIWHHWNQNFNVSPNMVVPIQ